MFKLNCDITHFQVCQLQYGRFKAKSHVCGEAILVCQEQLTISLLESLYFLRTSFFLPDNEYSQIPLRRTPLGCVRLRGMPVLQRIK